MHRLALSYYIHIFAAAHGIVCAACALLDLPDATLLTLLTMILTVIICTRHLIRVEVTSLAIIVVNICGFLLGTLGAKVIDLLLPDSWVPHMISTILTTELIGWLLYWLTRKLPRKLYRNPRRSKIGWLIFAIIGVFIVRLSLNAKAENFYFPRPLTDGAFLTDFMALVLVLFFAAILYGMAIRERENSHRSDLRYATLKNLVNPHFLFNSLNILDGLIDPDNETAKDYIRRLAGLYRYMTVHEGETLVQLSDERHFAKNYMDLMRIRFPGAIQTSVTVRDEELHTKIVPCSIQILLENAVKHNAFSPEHPLRVTVTTEEGWFIVRNNIQPRTSPSPSTGVGLHYIISRYQDICDRDIEIHKDKEYFTVRVPLIK